MDIDLSVLRSLESEKDISLDLAIKAIEDALLVAYHKTEGASAAARVEVDRKSGHVTVWAGQAAPEGAEAAETAEYDDTPAGFGRIAATTARQVILQRLRDVEDELTFGEYAGREGDIVAGRDPAGQGPADGAGRPGQAGGGAAARRAGARRAVRARRADQVLRAAGAQGAPRAVGHPVPHPPGPGQEAVRAGGARDRRRRGRDRRDRP